MQNKIDKIITLDNNDQYMVLDQGNYNGKCYFLTSLLDNNGNLTDEISILEETTDGNKSVVSSIIEERLFNALIEYFKKRFEVVA